MTRSQALTIGILAGFVVLACVGMVALIVFPYKRIFPPTPTLTSPAPTLILTPTLPKFLPTASLTTPTPPEPTATNTRVPTATPLPPRTPTPTPILKLPTFPPRSTPTPVIVTAAPVPSVTPSPTLTPRPASRQYSVSFSAKDDILVKGKCTDLRWQVEGASSVTLDEQNVAASGEQKVCPKEDTSYRLTVQLLDNSPLIHRTVTITVKEEDN